MKNEPTNSERAAWARRALATFVMASDGTTIARLHSQDLSNAISDLVCDLLHLAEQSGLDPEVITSQALSNFAAELSEENDPSPISEISNAAHQPGDWYISTCPETKRRFLCEHGKDDNIAELFGTSQQDRLIETAPKMLDALHEVKRVAQKCGDNEDHETLLRLILDYALPVLQQAECPETPETAVASDRLRADVAELLEAARAVIDNWERGNLADAVRALSAAIAKAEGQ